MGKTMWRKAWHLVFFFLCLSRGFALDFDSRLRPLVSLPYGGDAPDLFSLGYGGDLIFDFDISSMFENPLPFGYALGTQFGFGTIPEKGSQSTMQLYSLGLEAGLFYYPFSRLSLRLGGAYGMYQALASGLTYNDACWEAGVEAGFRFSPSFTLSAGAGYRSYAYGSGDTLYTSIFAGISAQISFETGTSAGNVEAELIQDESIFPVFLGLYKQNAAGVLRITNNESAEIRNVSVSFRAGNYTASRFLCGTIPELAKRRRAEIPLYADFSTLLFNFSENGRISGELSISYEMLGAVRETAQTVVLTIYNRNSFRWTDPAALAVFVSPTAPEVLDFSKYIIGLARNNLRTGLNQNMQFAIHLFEGLRTGGIRASGDRQTPYAAFHKDAARVDYIQFPFQTLAYRSGDIDDLGLLYAAALESAGIQAALIPLENDFLVAFSLGIDETAAKALFFNMDNVLVINDEVWLPLSFSAFREGFINCWYAGINGLNAALNTEDVNIVILRDAWTTYPPAAVSSQEAQLEKPLEVNVTRAVETDMQRYISAEFGPRILALREQLRSRGESASLYNQLGLLYVRSGMYAEAKTEYQRAAAMGSVPAMVNLGNIFSLERNFAEAAGWYRRALRADPANQAAASGLGRIITEEEEP
jgi:tetratricopeptide (TPR) repeat protein